MGKTRDLFKKIRDNKGTFHANMGLIKDRNGMDLTKAEDIKKRWQEYTDFVVVVVVVSHSVVSNSLRPIDCSVPGSFVHGIFQATVLEWIAISFSRGSSQSRARTWVSHIVDRCFAI